MSTTSSDASPTLTYDILQRQNAETSNAIIHFLSTNPSFIELAEKEGKLIQIRDDEDNEKLKVGIEYAQKKGVIDVNYVPQPYISIDVYQKTPNDVAELILQYVRDHPREAPTENDDNNNNNNNSNSSGYVIVLVGLSGTGKGTTVTQLVSKLQQQDYHVITWSNGNIFRCVTLLATTYWEQQQQQQNSPDEPFQKDVVLTKENIEMFMNMISFAKNPTTHQFDIQLNGFQYENLWISEIQNTLLKSSTVSKHIPTVAELTQGEVIQFAAKAVEIMTQEPKLVVLLEGREQTVNYVRSPYRFELVLSHPELIGQRRAAQRIMALAMNDPMVASVVESANVCSDMVETAILHALQALSQDMK